MSNNYARILDPVSPRPTDGRPVIQFAVDEASLEDGWIVTNDSRRCRYPVRSVKLAFCIIGPVAFMAALWGGRTATRQWPWLRFGSKQSLSQETETPAVKGWVHHKGLNCVNGHGGDIIGKNLISEKMHLSACMEACTKSASCEGILTMGSKDPGPCWVRASIHSSECFMHTPWDLWLRDPLTQGPQPVLPPIPAPASSTSTTTQAPTTVTTTSTTAPTTSTTATKTTVTVTATATTATTTTTAESSTTTSKTSTAASTTTTTTEKATTSTATTTTFPVTTRTTTTIATTTTPVTSTTPPTASAPSTSRHADTNTSSKGNETNVTSAPAKEDTGNPFFGALNKAEQAVADWVIDMLPESSNGPLSPMNQSKEPCKDDCVFKPEEPVCPVCAPAERTAPVVVVPTYERDLCKLKYLAKSLSQHDKHHNLGDVYIVWVSKHTTYEFEWQLGEIKNLISPTHKVHILDFSAQVQTFPSGGWYAQQILKLKIADVIKSEYYIVLDSKNALISDVEADTFLTRCNQAKIFGTYDFDILPGLHRRWYENSARRLNIPAPEGGRWPASITPMVIHTQTVLNMLKYIKEESSPYSLCNGPLCNWLFKGATEFTLYLDYARYFKNGENGTDTQNPKPSLNCTHAVIDLDWDHEVAVSLWRGLETNRMVTQKIAAGVQKPLMFGAQAGSLEGLEWKEHQAVAGNLAKIYENSRLYNSSAESLDEFVKCVA